MSRAKESVSLQVAAARVREWGDQKNHHGARNKDKLWPASWIADVVWPDNEFLTPQGAGAAASRVLKKIGAKWDSRSGPYGQSCGWDIDGV